MEFNDTQKRILETEGNLKVIASAGTGKTTILSEKMTFDMAQSKNHKVVAGITFTKKAANEIRSRMELIPMGTFIGTNDSFVIEEIVKPFVKDVYGERIKLETDYQEKFSTFLEGIELMKAKGTLGSYSNGQEGNFIFELSIQILKDSSICKKYLKSKYFKIYIDEYQDCDEQMHKFFLYICKEIGINLFIVGDEKQCIYEWRGARPDLFKNIGENDGFKSLIMRENYRSTMEILNHSHMLYSNTLQNIIQSESKGAILSVQWEDFLRNFNQYVNLHKEIAVLSASNQDAKERARVLKRNGMQCEYVDRLPIANISTGNSWFYYAIARYVLLDSFSVYDFVQIMPLGSDGYDIKLMKEKLEDIFDQKQELGIFSIKINELATYISIELIEGHNKLLFDTVQSKKYIVALEIEKYPSVSMTIHAAKGLEYEQIVIFLSDFYDYRARKFKIKEYYVAITRAKEKLIIIEELVGNSLIARKLLNQIIENNYKKHDSQEANVEK